MGKKLNRSGLRQEKIQTKKGLRTYWVKAGAAAKRVGAAINKHKGKIAAGAAVAAGAYIAAKHGSKITGAYRGAKHGLTMKNNVASALNTTASRREKIFGMALGAARGASLNAHKDTERMAALKGAPAGALRAIRSGALGLQSDIAGARREKSLSNGAVSVISAFRERRKQRRAGYGASNT